LVISRKRYLNTIGYITIINRTMLSYINPHAYLSVLLHPLIYNLSLNYDFNLQFDIYPTFLTKVNITLYSAL